MDNPTESRNHRSADNKKSKQNPHLSDEQLLLALDGESSAQEAAQVKGHLEACWSCRARREQIEKAIEDVVEYRDRLMKPYFPMPLGGRSMFATRLEQLALSVGRPPLWKRILRGPQALVAIPQVPVPQYVWIVILFGASIALFSFQRLWQVPKVSASQLLENAQGSEVRALHSVARPVLYQKLRIRVGSQVVMRTIYRDPIGLRQADRVDAAEGAGGQLASDVSSQSRAQSQPNTVQTPDAELRRTFQNARLNWQDPLSPASYSAWYKSLGEKLVEVSAVTDDLITLKTTTSEGPISEARITVRASDFHPVEEDLRLQDTRQVEVHELAWEVLPMEAINVSIFASETMQSAGIGHPSSLAPQPAGLTDAELAEAELQARLAIHDEKADLGEQIELVRTPSRLGQRSVLVQGIISTVERKDDLVAALRGIPHVDLRLQTVEEAQLQQNQSAADKLQLAAPEIAKDVPAGDFRAADGSDDVTRLERSAVATAGRPALQQQLEELFPIAENRAAFVNETLELLQDAMAQAWALRRLGNRYTPDMVTELRSGSQQTLELLIRDHVSTLRQDVDEVRNRVSPFLSPTPVKSVPLTSMPDAHLSPEGATSDWHSTILIVFSETQRVHDNGAALLAGSGDSFSEVQAVEGELWKALTELETRLPALYQQVSGPFLSEARNSGR
jgi:hypothetical protein